MIDNQTTKLPFTPIQQTTTVTPKLQQENLDTLRNQLWLGLFVTNLIVLVVTFIARYLSGEGQGTASLIIQGSMWVIALTNIYFRKSRYASLLQGIYVVCIHLIVPLVFVLYGGTRGFGDIALFVAVVLTLLYGWRRWMFITYGIMAVTLIWVLYRDSIGQPVAPLLDYSAQFTSLKFLIFMLVLVFVLRYTRGFYQSMLDRYRSFADEQVRLNMKQQQLNEDLKASRQKIITTREEERRRLRNDLHDGLGPSLAAQMYRVGVIQQLIQTNPEKAVTILTDLQSGIEGTLADIRQLVYGLRPPLLDQFGLMGAIKDFINQHDASITINLDLPSDPPPLSAAEEVATYRIIQTAVDNVVKHAQATHCTVKLSLNDSQLNIDIIDNGIGIPANNKEGVGLSSMRERAEELNGTLTITSNQPQGTHLSVSIPLVSESSIQSEGTA